MSKLFRDRCQRRRKLSELRFGYRSAARRTVYLRGMRKTALLSTLRNGKSHQLHHELVNKFRSGQLRKQFHSEIAEDRSPNSPTRACKCVEKSAGLFSRNCLTVSGDRPGNSCSIRSMKTRP